ncbi:benzoate/H(+) symporter BenE family transporter [Hoeflea sp.]|uniref:benzoate/H(+) symporter BenE family transporter n=1 Tax=Hoeflea sp. TaxID=1940281 RepID=UPI0019B56ED6|nr:benzoate/H(+) symporter BenE family transporter [Hoeflea sp.]MBC7281865.1 benzoate/H(+) symporter BenE family transporter [Hoeflea sp.]
MSLPVSMISAALVAALVGYGSTIALVLAAAAAVGADAAQTASWVAAICFSKAIGSALLSTWKKVPVVLAWSTPGAALIAASTGVDIHQAVGAFVFAGALIALTAAVRPLNRAVNAIPTGIASGMLAGVLLPFAMAVATHAANEALLVLPLVAVFLLVRIVNPLMAVLAALVTGFVIAFTFGGAVLPPAPESWALLTFITPEFDGAVLLGLGLPLYLVTMASQNLPGFAVLRANGYEPPVTQALGATGLLSAFFALFGAHTVNMAAITAAICLGEDVHPDRTQRWKVGLVYAAIWTALGLSGPVVVPAILAMPPAIIAVVAGLALISPLIGAIVSSFDLPATRFAAAATFAVTASGVAAFGIGAAFWGLLAGLLVHLLDHAKRGNRARP